MAAPDPLLERIPPHDEAAEAAVLGAMLLDERAANIAAEMLVEDDFYSLPHRLLFRLFLDLYASHPRLDEVEVRSELKLRGLTERVGGEEVLGRLVEACPSAAGIERYCRIVRDRAVERSLLVAARDIAQLCHEPRDDDEGPGETPSLLERAEGLVFAIADQRTHNETVPIAPVLQAVMDEAERHLAAKQQGLELPSPAIPTGFPDLDKKFAGGLWQGEVVVVAARPSVGKTTFGINIARMVATESLEKDPQNPAAVAIFSMEMPKEQVVKNILCAAARLNGEKMRRYNLDEEEMEVAREAAEHLSRVPIFIDDTPALTPPELRARARRLRHRENIRLLMVDYLQLMRSAGRQDNREQEVAELSRQIKQLARELGIPILLLSQLRRPLQGQEGARPNLTDLRESGAIEQDADVVIMLHRALDRDSHLLTDETTAIIQKNRNGEIGDARLTFIRQQLRFESYSPGPAGARDEGRGQV